MSQKTKTHPVRASDRSGQAENPDGFPASGCWINILDPIVGELVGRCGYDYGLIDMEHSPAAPDSVMMMIRAVQLGGAKALVRVPDKQPRWPGRLMDMGADGVMVPMVNNAAEARVLAEATLYAPEGTRGMAAGIVRASGYGVDTEHYLSHYRREFLLMIQMETRESVEQATQIAAVDGVDCVFVGPFDLAASLGNLGQPDHPETRSAIGSIREALVNSDKLLSTLATPENGARQLFQTGYDLVFSGMDVSMLREALQRDAEQCEALISERKAP